jgi:bifunctional DNA-binding transcriptional regulator/antitoxin component of YhaV-PrlF toxin-antitoxin module
MWLIPADEIEATSSIHLGGFKYSEFEIRAMASLQELVYAPNGASLKSPASSLGEYPSGQRTATVNRQAQPSQVRILPPPLPRIDAETGSTPQGQTRVSGNRQIVIPKRVFEAAGLAQGDRLKAFPVGPGEVVFRRIARQHNDDGPPRAARRLSREGL